MARIVPITMETVASTIEDDDIFGMWKDREQEGRVEDVVRTMREGRKF